MSTVGSLVDRAIFDFLEPPDELWLRVPLASDVDDTTSSWPLDLSPLSLEEQDLLATGVLIEADYEQAVATELSSSTLTVRRGARGTTAKAHSQGTEVLVAPPFTRTTVFSAVAESLVGLHPPLWAFRTSTETVGEDGLVAVHDDVLEVSYVRAVDTLHHVGFDDLGDWTTGRTIRVFYVAEGDQVQVGFRARFPYPVADGQALTQLGVRDEWGRIVVVGAAAQLISAKPMASAWQDYVTAQLRSEAYPVDTPARIRDSLIRYREYLIEQAATSLLREYPMRVVQVPM